MKKILKVCSVVLMIFLLIGLSGCNKEKEKKLTIVSTNYPGYDFARAILKNNENISIKMLLKPGADLHHYEPTPQDIIDIKNSKMFIYVGGDSDEWVKNILKEIDVNKTKVVKLMDMVNLVTEEEVEGMQSTEEDHNHHEDEEEYDEHVWTSPINAMKIVNNLKEEIIKIDYNNKKIYESNAEEYIKKLNNIDIEIKKIIKDAKRTEILFADRFPLRYFTEEYKLKYYAAFPGCAHETEASAKTISFLVDKVKEDKIPVVFHIELSDKKIAKTISKETGAKILEFNSAHNITKEDFDKGITYIDIMNRNIEALKEALN